MSVHVLGPRAALLLSVLSKPLTVAELDAAFRRGLDASLCRVLCKVSGVGEAEVRAAVEALCEGGASELRRLLGRMERVGLVRRQSLDGNSPQLWWRA